jgi:Holliday junction resolvase RusA-like endonuclease
MDAIRFVVHGEAKPQGSKRGFVIQRRDGSAGVSMVESSKLLKTWRSLVAAEAFVTTRSKGPWDLLTGPVALEVRVFRRRPAGHYGTGRNSRRMTRRATAYPTGRPDADKLVRAIGDALTGVVWRDDSQVVQLHVAKLWAEDGVERCEITVRPIAALTVSQETLRRTKKAKQAVDTYRHCR